MDWAMAHVPVIFDAHVAVLCGCAKSCKVIEYVVVGIKGHHHSSTQEEEAAAYMMKLRLFASYWMYRFCQMSL